MRTFPYTVTVMFDLSEDTRSRKFVNLVNQLDAFADTHNGTDVYDDEPNVITIGFHDLSNAEAFESAIFDLDNPIVAYVYLDRPQRHRAEPVKQTSTSGNALESVVEQLTNAGVKPKTINKVKSLLDGILANRSAKVVVVA